MGNDQAKAKENDGYSGMLVVCVKGKELEAVRLNRDIYTMESLAAASSLISRIQGSVEKTGGGYVFRLTSGFGLVWYNGEQIVQNGSDPAIIPMDHQDVIRIDSPVDGNTNEEALAIVYLSHYKEGLSWRTMDLKKGQVQLNISRHEEMAEGGQTVLEDLAELPKHYATLKKEEDNWYVEDHSTRFGVFVNQKKVEGRQKLMALDVISIGSALFLYQKDTLTYNHEDTSDKCLVIHIEERSVWNLFRKHVLLRDIDLTVRPGEMTLILGGSGAGKTTFVNAVMGYEKAKGKIMEGDVDIYENYNQMKYKIGFVPQQDLLRLEDTVIGTLENAAELKMPKRTSKEEREERINTLLDQFGLEREKESLVEKLSGGQRKRLSIAVEFVSDPTLFFLDEPDSGLDSVMARSLLEDLRVIANQNKMVLVITHSPDRGADLFDKVLVLAKGKEDNIGHIAFHGTVDEARQFFGTDSLEGVIRRINREDEGGEGRADEYIQRFAQMEERQA